MKLLNVKNILIFVGIICCSIFVFSNTINVSAMEALEGEGTADAPYIIDSADKWFYLSKKVLKGEDFAGCFFQQTKDIDFQNYKKLPSVGSMERKASFAGIYNGNGHVFKNVKISSDNTGAMFENLKGDIANIGIDSGNIKAKYAGAIVYGGDGHIYNCYNKATVSGEVCAAGIAADFNGIIYNCVNTGKVVAEKKAGICTGKAFIKYAYSYDSIVPADFPWGITEYGILSQDVSVGELPDILNTNSYIGTAEGDYLSQMAVVWTSSKGDLQFIPEKKSYFEGNGSADSPYLIKNGEDLQKLSAITNSGIGFQDVWFRQEQDILELDSRKWVSIGKERKNAFCGVYDGNGHTLSLDGIRNLFGKISGKVMNLGVKAEDSFGFGRLAKEVTEVGVLLNCWLDAGENDSFAEKFNGDEVNCVILSSLPYKNIDEKIKLLNKNLKDLVIRYGFHCDELRLWAKGKDNGITWGKRYTVWQFEEDTSHLRGAGTKGNPILIQSVENLICLRERIHEGSGFSGLYVFQTKDLDVNICNVWVPLGGVSSNSAFAGIYDGRGYNITGINLRNIDNQGLFGILNGSVQNLGVSVKGFAGKRSGGIAYVLNAKGKIVNSYVDYQIDGQGIFGEIVYQNEGLLINCYARSEKPADLASMSLAGEGQIRDCLTEHSFNKENGFKGEIANTNNGEGKEWEILLNDNLIETAYCAGVDIDYLMKWKKDGGIVFDSVWHWSAGNLFRFVKYNLKNNIMTDVVFLIILFWGIIGIVRLCLVLKAKRCKTILLNFVNSQKAMRQWFIILGIIVLFWDTCIWHKGVYLFSVGQWIFTVIIHMIFIFTFIKGGQFDFTRLKRSLYRYWELLLVLFVVSVIDIAHFWIFPIYDSNLYYGALANAVSNFKFTCSSFMSAFIIWGKPMQGVGLLASVGECLLPGRARGVYFVNLVLLLSALVCFYMILDRLLKNLDKVCKALLTLGLGFSSFILVGATYVNPDFYAAIFLIYILYTYMKKDYILFGFWGGILVFTKTNMILSYLAILLLILLTDLYSQRRHFRRAFFYTMKKRYWFLWTLAIYIMVLMYYMIIPLNDYSLHARSDLSLLENVQERLLQFGVYDFRWLLFLFAGFTAIWSLKQRIGGFKPKRKRTNYIVISWGMLIGTVLQLAMLCMIPLGLSPRYFSICMPWYMFMLGWCLNFTFYHKQSRKVILLANAMILFVQLFLTIDPAVMSVCQKEVIGNKVLYGMDTNRRKNPLCDIYIENYGYLLYGTLLDDALQQMKLEENTRLEFVNGNALNFGVANHPLYPIYWDKKEKGRTYVPNENTVALEFRTLGERKMRDNVYLIDLAPGTGTQKADMENQGYYVEKEIKVENSNVSMCCYHMKRQY